MNHGSTVCSRQGVGTKTWEALSAHNRLNTTHNRIGCCISLFVSNQKIKPAYVLEHGDAGKLGPTTIFGQVVPNGFQIGQACGLAGCHLVKTCFEVGLTSCLGCHLVEVADSLKDFCLMWLHGGGSNCVQSLLD